MRLSLPQPGTRHYGEKMVAGRKKVDENMQEDNQPGKPSAYAMGYTLKWLDNLYRFAPA
jgi:hypothetical protein